MKFSNQPPVWNNEGVEPSQDIQEEGFRAGYKPPASYFNWFWARVGRCLTELQQKLGGVSEGANKTGASGTNGNIQVDGAEVPVYRHPTGEGSAHIPAGGGAGQTLQRTASGYGWGIPVPTSVEPFLKDAPAETTVADGDTLPFTDVSDGSRTKKITWAGMKTLLNAWAGALFAAKSHSHPQSQVTGLETALSSKETPAGAQSKADAAKTAAISTAATDATTKANKAESNAKAASVPIGRKVNGKPLSADITLGSGDVGAVPTGRKVNGKALSADITLSPSDVGAAAASHGTHVSYSTTAPVMDGTAAAGSAATVARSDHKHPTDTSRAAASHAHTPAQAGLGNVPNVKTNDQVPTFTAATTRANLTSGEKLTVMLGKLAKWFADLKPVAWTGSYNDLTNKPAIPTVPGTLPPSGTAGGDLSGSYPNPTVKDDSHAHTLLSVKPDNFKDGAALPSAYPRGHCVFFSNAPANNKFNGAQYCTVVTIKGYSNMACVQYIYPYNVDAPIAYRYAIYNSDTWKPWRTLSIDGHAHAWGSITGKPTTFTPTTHNHGAGDITSGTLSAARGGTGYTTLQATRNAMGLGNTTGALPIANGGTGATTAAAALTALGGATAGHTHPPVNIPANADLNSYTTPGLYYCPGNATVVTMKNVPTGLAFYLEVGKHAGVYQRLVEYLTDVPKVYFRNYYANKWQAWQREYTTVDKPAWGDVEGKPTTFTPASHKHGAGDITSGTLPVARGGTGQTTVQALRNSMGLGNTTGAVPVANGGTGATTAAAALTALGGASVGHKHGAGDITSGTLPVSRGGTGKTSWAANQLLYPSSASALSQLGFPSGANSVLCQGTSGAPYWSSPWELKGALGFAYIASGTYRGTGTAGNSARCTINTNFTPYLVFVTLVGHGSNDEFSGAVFIGTQDIGTGFGPIGDYLDSDIHISWNALSIEWYTNEISCPGLQFNKAGSVYCWAALG